MAINPKSLVRDLAVFVTDMVARALDQDEREAVLGDLAESGTSEPQRFLEVAGLVLRRQAAAWRDWRPGLALLVFIVPMGLFLSVVSRLPTQGTSVYLWLYANNTNWELLHNRGFWYELVSSTLLVLGIYLKLACWSWAAGFLIGALTKKIWRSGYYSLVLTLLAGMVCASIYLPQYLEWVLRLLPHEDPVSQVIFYRTLLPIIVQLFIVAMPAISAMRHGQERLSLLFQYSVVLLSMVVVGDMLLHNSILWVKLGGAYSMEVATRVPHPAALSLVAYWPVAYLLCRTLRQRQQVAAVWMRNERHSSGGWNAS